jgi:DNA-binding beta-propeller fold protein YncE
MYQPHGLAISKSGKIYVADTANNRIRVFDTAGRLLVNTSSRQFSSYVLLLFVRLLPRGLFRRVAWNHI